MALVAFASCRGEVLDIGSDPARDDAGVAEVSVGDATEVVTLPEAVRARCEAPGSIEVPGGDRTNALLVGRWVRCRGDGRGALHFNGIEFSELDAELSAPWFALAHVENGRYARSTNPAERGRYVAEPPVSLRVRFENGSETTWVLVFDAEAQRFRVVRDLVSAVDVVYVKLSSAGD